jgi:hypothetical protein
MGNRSFFGVVVTVLVVLVHLLLGNSREESGETIEIVLGPFFPRVVVALGTLDTNPKKDLADVGGETHGDSAFLSQPRKGLNHRRTFASASCSTLSGSAHLRGLPRVSAAKAPLHPGLLI